MKRIVFIINQKSGTNRRKELEKMVLRYLDASIFQYEIVFTEYRGHAVELARSAAERGVEIVAAVGGDGSVNEVAQGITGRHSVLAIIPQGSGNGLARALGIPLSPRKAIRVINEQHIRKIDVGRANEQLFLSNSGVGFDALIARLFATNTGRGLLNYSRLVMSSLGKYKSKHYLLETDEGIIREEAFLVTAANGNQLGYNFKIAPDAIPDDGLLDICIMRPLRFTDLPVVSFQALSGGLRHSSYLKHLRCRTVTITRQESLEWMQVDGDAVPVSDGKVVIRLQAGGLTVIVP